MLPHKFIHTGGANLTLEDAAKRIMYGASKPQPEHQIYHKLVIPTYTTSNYPRSSSDCSGYLKKAIRSCERLDEVDDGIMESVWKHLNPKSEKYMIEDIKSVKKKAKFPRVYPTQFFRKLVEN